MDMAGSGWWFDGWLPILRTALVGTAGYAILVGALRLSGKRTLSKMNAFDLVVTIALGSTLASILLTRSVSLAQGVTAFATLIGLQTLVALASSRSAMVAGIVKSQPTLLAYRGRLLAAALRRERMTEGEVLAAIRAANLARLRDALGVILESDGTLSVVAWPPPATVLRDVAGAPQDGDTVEELPNPRLVESPAPLARKP